jgi:DNA-directed RNA polymerase specialized sigma24 family protein
MTSAMPPQNMAAFLGTIPKLGGGNTTSSLCTSPTPASGEPSDTQCAGSSELTREQQVDMFNYLMPLVTQLSRQMERKFYNLQKGELLTNFMEGAWHAVLKYDAAKNPSFWAYAKCTMKFFIIDEDRRVRSRGVSNGSRKGHIVMDLHELGETNFCQYLEKGYGEVETHVLVKQALAKCSPMTVEVLTRLDLNGEPFEVFAEEFGITVSRVSQLRSKALREAVNINAKRTNRRSGLRSQRANEFQR